MHVLQTAYVERGGVEQSSHQPPHLFRGAAPTFGSIPGPSASQRVLASMSQAAHAHKTLPLTTHGCVCNTTPYSPAPQLRPLFSRAPFPTDVCFKKLRPAFVSTQGAPAVLQVYTRHTAGERWVFSFRCRARACTPVPPCVCSLLWVCVNCSEHNPSIPAPLRLC